MNKVSYELIDHTADLGIVIRESDLPLLYGNAASAMFDLIYEGACPADLEKPLIVFGADLEDLMVNWLRELLYQWTGNGLLLKTVRVGKVTSGELAAVCEFCTYDSQRHNIKNEIKAVTYHQIAVTRNRTGWAARVIFDI